MRIGVRGIRRTARRNHRLAAALPLAALVLSPAAASAADPPAAAAGDMMQSAGWLGRVTMKLEAEATADVGMLPDTGAALAREWRSFEMLPLKMQGIAKVTDTAVVLRFKFTARPVKPSWVQREYLKAMYRVFAEKGIAFAVGALTLQSLPPPRVGPVAADGVPPAPTLVEELPAPSCVCSGVIE